MITLNKPHALGEAITVVKKRIIKKNMKKVLIQTLRFILAAGHKQSCLDVKDKISFTH